MSGVVAQTNGSGPAEMPPADYDAREFVDSRGCAFLRSTFGGAVTWVPRFGADRQPVCDATPTIVTTQPAPNVQPVPQPSGPVPPATAVATGKEPARSVAAPRRAPHRAAPRRAAMPRQADASGRHPDCPLNAPYGQVVRTSDARLMVLCVAQPDQFPEGLGLNTVHHGPVALPSNTVMPAPAAAPAQPVARQHGSHLQVGSFRVPQNATRLRARLQAHGLPAGIHHASGLNVVTVGPFAQPDQARHALQLVRGMGFHDAFFRR
ncbi:SPOR domain-containing protein [Roseinatronobacter sp.]